MLEFNTDFNSRPEYLWSHGLISDETYELTQKICNFSQIWRQLTQKRSLSPPCAMVKSQMDSDMGNIVNKYDVFLDVCRRGSSAQHFFRFFNQMVT